MSSANWCGGNEGNPKMTGLIDLWAGRLPLSTAFWNYAVFWGFFVNLVALAVSLVAVMSACHMTISCEATGLSISRCLLTYCQCRSTRPSLSAFGGVPTGRNRPLVSLLAKLAIAGWGLALLMAYLIIP